jgi:hypothetical protein
LGLHRLRFDLAGDRRQGLLGRLVRSAGPGAPMGWLGAARRHRTTLALAPPLSSTGKRSSIRNPKAATIASGGQLGLPLSLH